jgi:hypothetical protein
MKRMAKMIGILSLAAASFLAGAALAAQSNLERALDHLQAARNELEQDGGKDKGGYRKDALALVSQAIESVRQGIEHERKKKKD